MLKCVAYTERMRDEWDELAWSKGTVFHTTAFRQILLSCFGYRCQYRAVIDESGRLRAMIPLVAGRNLTLKQVAVSLPFVNYCDLCADGDESFRFAVESVKALKRESKLGYAELRLKDRPLADEAGWTVNTHNYTFKLPLEGGEEQVLALSSGNNRNHVRKVYKNDWFDVSFDTGHLDAFYRVYVRRMKQLGSPAPDIRYFRAFFERLPRHAFLLSVLDKTSGDVVGGMLLLGSPGNSTLYYPYGANLIEYNNKYLNNFMYWEAAKLGMRNGYDYLDLGRSPAGSGTYTFKEKWGAKPEQLYYAVYDGGAGAGGPPDKESLGLFVELWKKAPAFVTDLAGKKLIKYVFP
ncbi:GNAT family N-acetyltransferase [Paenibacillus ginsengarvi]|uniref:GNAT family N-acetyltransferase n=1 Tax=Paenibacillus ginsengarvi TaxID=400777 RepID=A0A3B0BXL4_9BACL|nr:GNAT family N-acetyltransferase [Paenibacillus ginsengarvi]RKN78255.1 GNAT family N-acetyltransferase [Paenibacillus ginsengarvi]